MNPNSEGDSLRSARGDSTDCSVNCNNSFGIYGFHEKGANILLCDGAVRFVTPKLDGLTFGRLTTRDDGQLIADDAF
jgi:prepilin-type processing-associated H-X9-DG protein